MPAPPKQPKGRPAVEGLMTIAQAAELKGIHRTSISEAIKAGRLPAYRVGEKGIYLLKKADVEAWQPKYQMGPKRKSEG